MFRFIYSDRLLLHQVIAFMALIGVVLVESSLGHVSAFYGVAPKLGVCLLFILAIKFPHAVTLFNIITAGLVFDLLQGNPLGYTSSVYLLVLLAGEWRLLDLQEADASTIWFEFVALIFGVMIYSMFIFALYEGQLPPITVIIFQIVLTVLVFPVLNWIVDVYRNIGFYFESRR
jgi:rod shape-determining protein MreD